METEKKVWQTKEFRDAKKNFQLDKKCSQCRSKKELTPHHLQSFSNLIFWKLREVAVNELCKQKGFTYTHSALTKTGGFSTSGGYIKLPEFASFINAHPEFKERATELAKVEYYSFKNIQTLCKRCHFAIEKGMILCEICKKKYHKKDFDSCFGCKEESERRNQAFEDDMDKQLQDHYK